MSLINVRDEKYNAIKNNPAFSKLNYEIIKGIAKSMQIGDYCKNSFVYRENLDKQTFMYIVKSGEFKMIKKVPQHSLKSTIEITILQRGETFGAEHYNDGIEQSHKYSVHCSSIVGQLYILSYQNFRSILINHQYLTPLSIILKQPTQQVKERLYLLREQLLLNLNTQAPQQNTIIKQRIRSQSTQLSYTDKINLLIRGQKSQINTKSSEDESFDEDKYMHQSILHNIRAMRTNLTEQSSQIFKRRHTISDVNDRSAFIKHEDYRSKMKILNHLGYKPKLKAQNRYMTAYKII